MDFHNMDFHNMDFHNMDFHNMDFHNKDFHNDHLLIAKYKTAKSKKMNPELMCRQY